MANTLLGTEKVKQLTKYGFQNEAGEYVNYSKNLKEGDKVNIVPGRSLQVELYIADSGKKYVNKVINAVESADVPLPVVKKTLIPDVSKKAPQLDTRVKEAADKPMLRADWDAKDRRISRQGVIQAAVQAVASFSTQEDLYDNAEALAEKMLKFVNE